MQCKPQHLSDHLSKSWLKRSHLSRGKQCAENNKGDASYALKVLTFHRYSCPIILISFIWSCMYFIDNSQHIACKQFCYVSFHWWNTKKWQLNMMSDCLRGRSEANFILFKSKYGYVRNYAIMLIAALSMKLFTMQKKKKLEWKIISLESTKWLINTTKWRC